MQEKHAWELAPAEARKVQEELSTRIVHTPLASSIRYIAGVDCAYITSTSQIVCSAVLCTWPNLNRLETQTVREQCRFPYVPGLLSFREAPAVINAVERLSIVPDLVLCDGQGIAHPRGLGLAAHVGLWLGLPTVGVAKKRLCGIHREPGKNRGCATQLYVNACPVGKVVRTQRNVKPVYVSPGHLSQIADSVRWTLKTARRYRLPEPIRFAHSCVTQERKR